MFVSLFRFSQISFGQGVWEVQNPLPTAEPLSDVYCLPNTSYAWATGSAGCILKTVDAGNTWVNLNSGSTEYLHAVWFADVNTGWIAGSNGAILKTINGGNTWTPQNSGTTKSMEDLHFIDKNTGWAMGNEWQTRTSVITKTINGGTTWTVVSTFSTDLRDIFFINSNNGWACGRDGSIFRTVNGGLTWTLQSTYNTYWLTSIHFYNSQVGWALGDAGLLAKTTDGGITWNNQLNALGNTSVYDIYFFDGNIGYAIGYDGAYKLLKTINGGTTWTTLYSEPLGGFHAIDFSNLNSGLIVGRGTFKTTDGGSVWLKTSVGIGLTLRSIKFTDVNNGWAVGFNGTILNTKNGGSVWTPQTSGTTNELFSVFFINSSVGWAVGANGTILKTSNGGTTWGSQISGTTNRLSSVFFANSSIGWAVGFNGTLLKTVNGGASWALQSIGSTNGLCVYFLDTNTGWVSGIGTIQKTINGGTSWTSQTIGTSYFLYNLRFLDANIGWTCTQEGKIFKTINGGSTWNTVATFASEEFNDIFFSDNNNGCVVGYGGIIRKTIDGGITWIPEISHTNNSLISACFASNNDGWTTGAQGVILHYTNYSPNTQSNNLLTSNATYQSVNVTWTRGNGNQCALFVKQANTGSCTPDVNVTYLPNATFSLGDQIGNTGWYCVYNGTGTFASINGLQPNTSYRFHVCEYNFSPDFTHYNSKTATNNPLTAITAIAPPQITGNPSASTKCEASNTSFSVSASGSALSYQWKESSGANITNGVVYSGANTATLTLTGIPANLNGNKYYCVVSNISGSATSSDALLTVNPLPVTPDEITGDQIVCRNTSYTYFVPIIQNATSYDWTFPTGFSGISTTNSINLTTSSNSVAGIISVKGKNGCGSGPVKNFSVDVKNLPADASLITGSDEVCTGSINIGYNTSAIADAEYYIWSLPLGATGSSSINSIMVSYGNSPLSDQVTVKGHNMCGDGVPSVLPVNVLTVPSLTGSISGSSNVCKNQQGVPYSITLLPEATSYLWTLPSGVTGSNSTNNVSLKFGPDAFSGDLKVAGVNSCGTGPAIVFPVIVDEVPAPAGTISGLSTVCRGQTNVMYTIPQSERATYYVWDLPDGSSETTVTSKIILNFSNTASSGTLYVTPFNSCGAGPGSSLFINVPVPPSQTINAAGPIVFCDGGSVQLSVGQVSNVDYQWLKDGGSVGENSSLITARVSGTYSMILTNTSGCSAPSANSIVVKVNPAPSVSAVSLSGATKFCEGGKVVLSVSPVTGQSYSWRDENGPITGAVNSSYDAIRSGNYRLEVSNSSGCMVLTESVNVNVGSIPTKPQVDPGRYSKGICLGETPLKLGLTDVTEGYTYQWFRNGAPISNSTFIEGFLDPGYYYVQAQLGECSKASDSLNVVFQDAPAKPVIDAKGPTIWYLTSSITNAAKYKWYYNGKLIPGAEGYLYVANQKLGKYNVSISNDKLCFTISDTITIPVGITGIEDTDPFTELKIYPNPTPGMFTIEMNNNVFGELAIDIITQNGSKILNIKFEKTTEHFSSQIDLSGQSKGMYLINLSIDKFKTTRKILVE